MIPDHPKVRRDEDGNLWLNFGEYGQSVELAAISGDGRRALLVQEVGVARVWNVDTGEALGEFRPVSPLEGADAHSGNFQTYIESVALDHRGECAILGLNDGRVVVYDVDSGELRHVWHEPEHPTRDFGLVRALAVSPDGSLVVAGFWSRSAGVWRLDDGKLVAWLCPAHSGSFVTAEAWGRESIVSSIAVSADNRNVFTGCADMTAVLWDLETGQPVRAATEHSEDVLDISLHADGSALSVRWLTSGGTIWSASNREEGAARIATTNRHCDRALWMPDGTSVVARESGGRRYTRIDLAGACEDMGPAPRGSFDQAWYHAATSVDGRVLLLPRTHDELEVVAGDRQTKIRGEKDFSSCRLSPCGRWLVTSLFPSSSQTLWWLPDGAKVAEFSHDDVVFASDASRLAVGTWDRGRKIQQCPVLVFDLVPGESPRLAARLDGHTRSTMGLGFVGRDEFVTASPQSVRWWSLRKRPRFWSRRRGRQMACHPVQGAGRFVAALDNRQVLLDRANGLEVWTQDGCLHRFETDHSHDSSIVLDKTHRFCAVATYGGRVVVCDLQKHTETLFKPAIEQPGGVPSAGDVGQRRPLAGAAVWDWPGGPYLHQSDGPRGWITPVRAINGAVVIPCDKEAVALRMDGAERTIIGTVPFDARLRAGVATSYRLVVVGDDGRLIAVPLADGS